MYHKFRKHIPLYRAKCIANGKYVIGYLKKCTDTGSDLFWIQTEDWCDYQVDINTLAIHFPDMIDSKDNKIFASLSDNGTYGDIVTRDGKYFIIYYKSVNGRFEGKETETQNNQGLHNLHYHKFSQSIIIGINE